MKPAVLVCTVGGSPAPIITALGARPWSRVLFVCTPQSEAMVTGHVTVPARQGAPAATMPSIPVQAGLLPAQWTTVVVKQDDPDEIFAVLIAQLDDLQRAYPDAAVTVDFTGGTKSMSAGAVLAAASRPGTGLQVTSGQRSDLVRVVDGTQQAIGLGTDRIATERQIELLRGIWAQYGYQEAAEGFTRLLDDNTRGGGKLPDELVVRLRFWKAFAMGFAAWDRFDRIQAAEKMKHCGRTASPEFKRFTELAATLCRREKNRTAEPLVLFDLLRNAQRCAFRGRHDDAVARCYRLWEWTVQWLLRAESGIDTGDVDPSRLPAGLIGDQPAKKNGRVQIGSSRAWHLYRHLHPASDAARFWNETDATEKPNTKQYEKLSFIRNHSILAHGARPIDAKDSKRILDWTAGPFMDMLRAAARRLGEPDDLPQLPTMLPEWRPAQASN